MPNAALIIFSDQATFMKVSTLIFVLEDGL